MKYLRLVGFLMLTGIFNLCRGEDALTLVKKGATATDQGNYQMAVRYFNDALTLQTNYDTAWCGRGIAFKKMNQLTNALQDFTRCIAVTTDRRIEGIAFWMRGDTYFKLGETNRALDDYSQSVQINPYNFESFLDRAIIYNQLGKYSLAETDCDISIGLKNNVDSTYTTRAAAKMGQNDFDGAMFDYNKAIKINPTNANNYVLRSGAFSAQGAFAKAVDDCNQAIRLKPDVAELYAIRGMLRSKTGDFQEGIEDCRKSISIDANSIVGNNNLAWLLSVAPDAKLRNAPEAVKLAEKACALTGWTDAYCLETLSAAYAEAGDFEKAVKWQKKSMAHEMSVSDLKLARIRLDLFLNQKPFHEKL